MRHALAFCLVVALSSGCAGTLPAVGLGIDKIKSAYVWLCLRHEPVGFDERRKCDEAKAAINAAIDVYTAVNNGVEVEESDSK